MYIAINENLERDQKVSSEIDICITSLNNRLYYTYCEYFSYLTLIFKKKNQKYNA